MRRIEPTADRFFRKAEPVTESGCWLWTAYINHLGYGKFQLKGKWRNANRVCWELINGPIPDGMDVLHKCDIRCCVNPNHLFLGTHTDNMQDMIAKGRAPRRDGEHNGNAKITREQAEEIRALYAPRKTSASKLGRSFGLSESSVLSIIKRKSWN